MSYEVLEAVGEGSDFFDALTCDAMSFAGSGTSSEEIEVFGIAAVFDACGTWLSLGSVGSTVGERITVGPAPFSVTVYTDDNFALGPDDVPVVMLPTAQGFIESLLLAGSGECLLGGQPPIDSFTGEPRKGFALAAWEHCADDVSDPPRTGSMSYSATGFCPVDQSAGAGGESAQ